jgi:hypothetical protein
MSAGSPPKKDPQKASSAKEERKLKALTAAAALYRKGCSWLTGDFRQPRVKYSHASHLLVAAAEQYRMFLQWRSAADAYAKACEAERAQSAVLAAAVHAADSAECFARVDANEAVKQFRVASGLFATQNHFLSAANLMTRAAELDEVDGALNAAAASFTTAAHYFLADDEVGLAVRALKRAGECQMLEQAFEAAFESFERAARVAYDDNLIKFHAPRLALNAGLALLAEARQGMSKVLDLKAREARDAVEARLEAYVVLAAKRDFFFSTGRDRRFLCDCIDTSKLWAWDDFMDHVWNFDDVACLEPHELNVLECISDGIREGPPPELAKARREAADLSRVVELEEDAFVEVSEMVPQTHAEMVASGLLQELQEEEGKDKEEADQDEEAEFQFVHGISKEEHAKRELEEKW